MSVSLGFHLDPTKGLSVPGPGPASAGPVAVCPLRGQTDQKRGFSGKHALSAKDATGLEEWLVDNKYKIPSGAAPLLRPYIQSGMKFFVAKVDTQKVKFENGVAKLSDVMGIILVVWITAGFVVLPRRWCVERTFG